MSIKPIMFNTEMVQAILDERKMQMRRIIKTRYGGELEIHRDPGGVLRLCEKQGTLCRGLIPPYEVGDIMWVKEAWTAFYLPPGKTIYKYRATDPYGNIRPTGPEFDCHYESRPWERPNKMPREAARIFLRITDVRVNKLNYMEEQDAIAEGFRDSPAGTNSPLERFSIAWDKRIKRSERDEFGWYANPWVWVIIFERCEKPAGWWEVI